MRLLTGDRTVTSGITGKGQMFISTKSPAGMIMKTTRNPIRFLQILCDAIIEDAEVEAVRKGRQLDEVYQCKGCTSRFEGGQGGVRIDGKHEFCQQCHSVFNHYDYLRVQERMGDDAIWYITENFTEHL